VAVKLFLADDHPIVVQGMRSYLEREPDLRVVGEGRDGVTVVEEVERLQPDLALVDIIMPGLSGLEITRLIQQHSPKTRVIILSMYADEPYVVEALKAGAMGYVLKGCDPSIMLTAVREVLGGNYYLCPPLNEKAIQTYLREASEEDDEDGMLTPREREVLCLAADGLSNSGIAEKLTISVRTVEVHRARMMHKLGLHSQRDLLQYALRNRIIVLDA
jgi:DNA-binding NarL/FixJ family response regulator